MAGASQLVEVDPAVFLDPTITTILAGPDRIRYAVHKALLCQKSGYFARAYNTTMKEPSQDTFTISDLPDEAFRTLITWLYTGKVFLQPGKEPSLSVAVPPEESDDEADDDDDDGSIRDGWYQDSDKDPDSGDDEMEYEDEDQQTDLAPKWTLKERPEAFRISQAFPHSSNLSDLDSYQLNCLVRMYEHEPYDGGDHSEFLDKCKALLKQSADNESNSRESSDQGERDTYDHLIDIYILADRFDIQGLRIDIMNLIEEHQGEQEKYITDSTLPTLPTIAKVCENLPHTSDLRLWLVHGMAFEFSAQAAELEILPKDFLVDVLATMGQKVKWLWTKDDLPQYQDQCLCHIHESEDEVKRRLVNGVGD
ncbi:uncharacterized protein MYCFIDRAFT_84831 [Pseudocercospora fijiensis CIRAD86]|uniref:BTB domain-containing protein n=1 Tax=Pseudocercospora fijiensis (strain CIRAD86) TaxID=383855 RepID=M3AJV2_PSEFD|nr:uncharacterized protein MYCFIDRAFT_84831 [Pseudocercospora fijiensis CIRAD86]EME77732.1 hypothetical protein MYCFIDRAFT_84831 [Pseudocercospora fijiensis CIRAD86]